MGKRTAAIVGESIGYEAHVKALGAAGWELAGRIGAVEVLTRGAAVTFTRDEPGKPVMAAGRLDFAEVPEAAVLVALTARYAALTRGGDANAAKMLDALRAAWRVHVAQAPASVEVDLEPHVRGGGR